MSRMDQDDRLREIEEQRAAATEAIVRSVSEKKLIVAGPGTGKTHTFKEVLKACEQTGLALTFIRNLVVDLEEALGDIADVFTFHRFCKRQLHLHPDIEGLEDDWHYYPPLFELLVEDFGLLEKKVRKKELEWALHTLDDSEDLISDLLALTSYYNAVSHTDLVYRMLRYFEQHEDQIPEYPQIVVDEYQDFSLLETSFLHLLATRSRVLIAGDDDQALYSFKSASPQFIRDLAQGDEYENFELPFCSRCTEVVVAAVNDGLRAAIAHGNLDGRLEKPFECYVPDKQADSEAHPKIIHAQCSVERPQSPYVGRYVSEQIAQIPAEDIEESIDKGYPTVLVIGPNPFLRQAHAVIKEQFAQAELKKAPKPEVELLHGYRRLVNDEGSRLGWRIVIHCDSFPGADQTLADVLENASELAGALPEDYRARHLELVGVLRRLLTKEELSEEDTERLCRALGYDLDSLLEVLELVEEESEEQEEGEQQEHEDEDVQGDGPSIICTSLVGAKGLSAGYVFIVGFNDGHIPQHTQPLRDEEICAFLVALSRTRKECHLVSCRFLGREKRHRSTFGDWIAEHIEQITVDAKYFK